MRETDFIERNQEKWERYEESLKRDDQDPETLRQLYIQTTDDLSISRTFYPNRSVRVYLNGLAQRTFLRIYQARRGQLGRFFTFWTDELPRAVHASRRPLTIALLTFVLAMLIGVLSFRIDPDFAETILGERYVAMTEANIAAGDPMAVYKSMDSFDMSLYITFNNILVALRTFLAGAFFCVGTLALLIRNGVMLGVFQYFFFARGGFEPLEAGPVTGWIARAASWLLTAGGSGLEGIFLAMARVGGDNALFRESLLTIWIHGALEISSIVLAGGAGLTLGSGLLFPGTLTRLQAFGRSARRGLKIMLGTIPLFIVAGFLEGYVTRQTDLPDGLRFLFILLCFGFIIWYYVVYPRVVAARPQLEDLSEREPAATRTEPYGLSVIRGAGDQLLAAFGVMRRSVGRLLAGCILIAAGYCLLSFGFGGEAMFRYRFVGYFFGEVENVYELLSSFGRDRGFFFLLLVAGVHYALFRLAFGLIGRHTDLEEPAGGTIRELQLVAISFFLALVVAFGPLLTALLFFLTYPFLVCLGVGTYLYGQDAAAVFRTVYTNLGVSYGLTGLLLVVALPATFLIDSIVFSSLFSVLDWIVYTDVRTIDSRNVILQAFTYFFLFSLTFTALVTVLTLGLGSLREVEGAGRLKSRIRELGRKRRLGGMERE
jgi:uncharacterized membrane protein SpoIIM required for sporulation